VGHSPEEGRAGSRIDLGRLPVDAIARLVADALGADPLAWATGGGEDYELLVTCTPGAFARLADGLAAATGTRLTAIGEIAPAGEGVRYRDASGREVAVAPGFEHFVTGARMSDGLIAKLLGLLVLVACSALFTGAEAAYFSLGRARLKRAAAEATEAEAMKPLIERPHELLVTLLVGVTLINIAAAALAALTADQLFGDRYGLVIQIVGTILVLTTFGEVLPMTLAVKYPERFLAQVHRPVGWLGALLRPLRVLLGGLTALTVRLIGSERAAEPELSEEELRTLVDVGEREGVVEREEREMIHKVFELEDTLVRSVMVPRPDMFC